MLNSNQLARFFSAIVLLTMSTSVSAAPRTYTYTVEHPPYGAIGTYTDTVDQSGEAKRIDTKVRVAVKILGIVVHREEADRTERWQGERLLSFHSVTSVNGKTIEVRGEARGDGFVVTSPSGTVIAPPNVYTTSPWSAGLPNPETMVVPGDGRVERAQVTGGEMTLTSVHGAGIAVRHYEIVGSNRYDVWSSLAGVPIRFRSDGRSGVTEFVLRSEDLAAAIDGDR